MYIVLHSTCLQNDMQMSVRKRLGDQSTLVREATVDLLGRFILTQPEISQQYYDMLSERILVCICNYHFCFK